MSLRPGTATRVTILMHADAYWHHHPLSDEIIHRALEAGLAGASRFAGLEGFGSTGILHTDIDPDIMSDLPCEVVIVDPSPERVRAFLPQVEEILDHGLITLDTVEVAMVNRPALEEVMASTPPRPEAFDVIVEVPGGSRNKYEMDKATGRIRLDRTLFTATQYPCDYGYIEHTLAHDGDPVDALVLTGAPTFPGCLVRVRAVAVYLMSDEHGRDDKLLCVPAEDPRWTHLQDVGDIPTHLREEIAHFFRVYKSLEPGKHVVGSRWEGREAAYDELRAARARAGSG